LGLIYLETGKNKEALSNFKQIAAKYPRFYPVYYAMAQAKQNMGDMRGAMTEYKKAEDLVRGYVKNPQKNPLDKPTITAGTNSDGMNKRENETEEDVMNRFNQLVTVSSDKSDAELSFNEKIKGKVQDRDMKVEPEPVYAISMYSNTNAFHTTNNYFRELDELNSAGYLKHTLFLSPNVSTPSQQSEIERLFDLVDSSTEDILAGSTRPVDYLNRGILYFLLKNYDDALTDLDKALESNDEFTVAYMARAYVYYTKAGLPTDVDKQTEHGSSANLYQLAMADYDVALKLNPRLVYAWFNKGTIYYQLEDYTSALRCFNEAIAINPDFAEAYYNRGITYLRLGNKQSGTADLSKAGELGILPSYNLLKKMN
jgi:tetratricopeptide (TPR) repeat protein